MNSIQLQTGVLDGGVRSVNFFNGRTLTSEDLTQERTANRAFDERLGQLVGAGVASGLEVRTTPNSTRKDRPTVAVAPGLAMNGLGQTLALATPVELELTRDVPNAPPGSVDFGPCAPPQTAIPTVATGVYVLVIGPATQRVGRAPVNDSLAGGCGCRPVTDCQARDLVEGVQFRLVPLPLSTTKLASGTLLRSLIARACLGLNDPEDQVPLIDPTGQPAPRGLVSRMQAQNQITPCEVPLAVIAWDAAAGVFLVDRWAVRRRTTRPSLGTFWGVLLDDERRARAESLFLQFQEHSAELIALLPQPETLRVNQVFGHLPPLGFLPLATSRSRGVNPWVFFLSHCSTAIPQIDAAQVPGLLEESLTKPVMDLQWLDTVQLYVIRENVLAFEAGAVSQLTLVFASADLPHRATARFDAAPWDLSRFSPSIL